MKLEKAIFQKTYLYFLFVHARWFLVALLILLLFHYSVLNFWKYDFWKSFSNWFVGL